MVDKVHLPPPGTLNYINNLIISTFHILFDIRFVANLANICDKTYIR
jgi:hypothetical protein